MKISILTASILLNCGVCFAQKAKSVDLLIKNAVVFTGDGKDSLFTQVGITGDRITYLGKDIIQAKEVIDAKGKYLAPGFIDTHTHADRQLDKEGEHYLLPWANQGVTSVFIGNDGFGTYKVADALNKYKQKGLGVNVGFLIGFGPLRSDVVGMDNVKATEAHINKMKQLLSKGFDEGALGFSTGLIYLPQMFSSTDEIIALAKEAHRKGGFYDSHMRNEGNELVKSVYEVLEINKQTNIPVHIAHLKAAGSDNWGKSVEVIDIINKARANGVAVTADQYPFVASSTSLKATVIPAWAQEGGDVVMLNKFKDNATLKKLLDELAQRTDEKNKMVWIMSKADQFKSMYGKSLYQNAQELNISVGEFVVKCLQMDPTVAIINFMMNENDIVNYMTQPWVVTGSDGGGVHPRTYASFTRIIEEYVIKKKILNMATAVRRGSGLTADIFKLKDRGYIKEGYFADLLLFDPNAIKANANFENPEALSSGMEFVFINGEKVIDQGKNTMKLPGQALLKN